jgi:hypothetical protein
LSFLIKPSLVTAKIELSHHHWWALSLSFRMTLVKKCGVLARMVNFVSGNTSGTEIRLNMYHTE